MRCPSVSDSRHLHNGTTGWIFPVAMELLIITSSWACIFPDSSFKPLMEKCNCGRFDQNCKVLYKGDVKTLRCMKETLKVALKANSSENILMGLRIWLPGISCLVAHMRQADSFFLTASISSLPVIRTDKSSKWDLNWIINVKGFWRDASDLVKVADRWNTYGDLNADHIYMKQSRTTNLNSLFIVFPVNGKPKAQIEKCRVDVFGFYKSMSCRICNWSNIFQPQINSPLWNIFTLILIRLTWCPRFSESKGDMREGR